jgi:hypothetical protein
MYLSDSITFWYIFLGLGSYYDHHYFCQDQSHLFLKIYLTMFVGSYFGISILEG